MIRKFMVGAMAAAMPLALLSTGAGAAAGPSISSISVSAAQSGNADGGAYNNGMTVGYGSTVTITVTGTNLNTSKMGVGDISLTGEPGFAGVLAAKTWKINSVSNKSSTGFTVNATAPGIAFHLAAGGSYPTKAEAAQILTGGGATSKKTTAGAFNLGSNCGPLPTALNPGANLPINSATNSAYVDGDFADPQTATKPPTIFKPFFMSKPSVYTDIQLVKAVFDFTSLPFYCSADIKAAQYGTNITATSAIGASGFYGWATNYGVWGNGNQLPAVQKSNANFIGKVRGVPNKGNLGGISFALPITTVGGVNVTNSVITLNIPKKMTVDGCSAQSNSDSLATDLKAYANANSGQHSFFRDANDTTCTVLPGGKQIQITDAADHLFDQGTFLDMPSIKLTGVNVSAAGSYGFTLAGTTSTITTQGLTASITFNPRAKSASIAAPLFTVTF